MFTIALIIGIVILVIILTIGIVIFIRSRRFKPTADQTAQQEELNNDIKSAGFSYELQGDYFYSLMYCWQREVGYCRLYDDGAPLFNMIIDCEPITFEYDQRRWLIELWKGQYGITTGAEIGIYCTDKEDIQDKRFTGTFYENISDEERIQMSFVLKKKKNVILRRGDLHWWLTGFVLGEFSNPKDLTMEAQLTFPNEEMRDCFIGGLKRVGYQSNEYSMQGMTVSILYKKPYSPQPISRNAAQMKVVQKINKNNCKLYRKSTKKYKHTLDKVEYIKALAPELYHIFIKSLYAQDLYLAFDWIREIIFKPTPPKPEPPKPEPPKPEPPCPEPPKPPCPPEPPCPEPPEPPCPEPPEPCCPIEPPKPRCPEPPKPCCPEPPKSYCPEPPKPCCPKPPKPCCPKPPEPYCPEPPKSYCPEPPKKSCPAKPSYDKNCSTTCKPKYKNIPHSYDQYYCDKSDYDHYK